MRGGSLAWYCNLSTGHFSCQVVNILYTHIKLFSLHVIPLSRFHFACGLFKIIIVIIAFVKTASYSRLFNLQKKKTLKIHVSYMSGLYLTTRRHNEKF